MVDYVRRINEETLRVTIGGVRIGSAKYSRLAQINLHSRIITFSRYAIENVPERGRRYLVLHELAHVREASHNKEFWRIVAQFEPDYKAVSAELEKAFHHNVRQDVKRKRLGLPDTLPPLIWTPKFDHNNFGDNFGCSWEDTDDCQDFGIISGGCDED